MGEDETARVEELARAAYGRLLAILAAKTGDIAAAEDALADAFVEALRRWPKAGAPDNPEGWLLTVARNRWRDRLKSAANRTAAPMEAADDVGLEEVDPEMIPDNRLMMMFVAAHPAIAAGVRTPLMLQTVLGLEADRIGSAFLVPKQTMAQRLVRAKAKIKAAAIPFRLPERSEMPERMAAVLEAIYGAYALDWAAGDDLTREAVFLADLTVELAPEEPEALGLAALLAFSEARRPGRDPEIYAPLADQDPKRWDQRRIARGEALLKRARAKGAMGRFQLEAAIQSAHCARRPGEAPDWRAIAMLYEGLFKIAPTIGAAVGRAAAFGEAFGPENGLAALDQIGLEAAKGFQPYWATRARLLAAAGAPSAEAFAKAISLTPDPAPRRWLEAQNERART
ncbi:MAG: DUF6596 domain-containing protein [Pseudomonadota bacterium]